MSTIGFITDAASLDIDFDMPYILDACQKLGVKAEICEWDDIGINWACFDAVILRSPWDCIHRMPEFLSWCEKIESVTRMLNPLSVVKWNLDKHYLADLSARGVPVVPSKFVEFGSNPLVALRNFFKAHPESLEVVIKPTVGSYSRGVKRFRISQETESTQYIATLLGQNKEVILQPYLESIDVSGETNITYFNGIYSHAICKGALLRGDGVVNAPLQNFREVRIASEDERVVALGALNAAASHLGLKDPLLYGRVDLIRDQYGQPTVLEVEIFEPSLNLPFNDEGALKFVAALKKRLNQSKNKECITDKEVVL